MGTPVKIFQYKKVGRLSMTIAKRLHLKSADILLSPNAIIHLRNNHGKELNQIGMTPLDFVKFVVSNFNQVRKGTGDSYLLVVYHEKLSKISAIELKNIDGTDYWNVNTACPMRLDFIDKKPLLWQENAPLG